MKPSCLPAPNSASVPQADAPEGEPVEGGLLVTVHKGLGDILQLAPEWRALLENASPRHPFFDPAWHHAWWSHLGTGALYICAVRREDGSLLAVAPWTLGGDGTLRFTGGEDVTDYLDIVAAEGDHPAAWRALLAHLEGPGAPDWRALDLHCVPEDSPTVRILSEANGPAGGRAEVAREEVCPVVSLPDSVEEYLGMLSSRDEREMRRKVRKAHMEPGLEFHRTLTPAQLEEDIGVFFHLHALSHPEKADFWNEGRRGFFREMAREMLMLGWLDLTIMRVDDHPVAANFSFDFDDRIYLYNSGFDPEERALSGGLVLIVQNIEEAIQGGRKAFDMLRGDEKYKYSYGAEDEFIMRVRLKREEG